MWGSRPRDPEALLLESIDSQTLGRLMEQLPAEYREVLLLREVEDLAYKEIAEVTGVPIGTVMSRLSRARLSLRKLWLAAGRDGGRPWSVIAPAACCPGWSTTRCDRSRGCASAATSRAATPARARLEELRAMQAAIRTKLPYHRAPPGLAARIGAALPREAAPPASRGRGSACRRSAWPGTGLAGALAGVALTVLVMGGQSDPAEMAVIGSHIRSMQAEHLTDVATSDQHTVKPWLSARLDVSPPVRDLKEVGFPLVGGRMDYVDGHPAAAVVYTRAKHVINLFAWASAGKDEAFRTRDAAGLQCRCLAAQRHPVLRGVGRRGGPAGGIRTAGRAVKPSTALLAQTRLCEQPAVASHRVAGKARPATLHKVDSILGDMRPSRIPPRSPPGSQKAPTRAFARFVFTCEIRPLRIEL